MKTFNPLQWRQFFSLFRTNLRPPMYSLSLTSNSYTHTLYLSSFSSLPRDSHLPANFLHSFPNQLFNLFCSQSLSNPEFRRCWKCNSSPTTSAPFLVCDSCRCIQPVDPSLDYFRIFGLDQKYDIEESSLEGTYKDWQKKLHPDLVHSKSESEKEYAAEQSSRVIDAYTTLRNSLSRAIYLGLNTKQKYFLGSLIVRTNLMLDSFSVYRQMKLQGVHVDEEQTVSDPELLAEIMEIRESVEEAPDSRVLKRIQTEVQEKMEQWSENFAGAFENHDTEEALNAIRRMTYYKRATEEIVKRL